MNSNIKMLFKKTKLNSDEYDMLYKKLIALINEFELLTGKIARLETDFRSLRSKFNKVKGEDDESESLIKDDGFNFLRKGL